MTDSRSSQRAEGEQSVDMRVERAIDALIDKLTSPASPSASASVSASVSSLPPSPPSYHSTFLPLSPPPSPPSPAPSLSLLGKLALSNYMAPSSPSPELVLSPPFSDSDYSHSPVPSRPLFTSVSPPPVPALFSRPRPSTDTTPASLRSLHPSAHSHRTPPRLPSFSPPPISPAHTSISYTRPSPSYTSHISEAAVSVPAPFHTSDVRRVWERRKEGECELAEDEWRIPNEADVRRMLNEVRDELQHVAHKLTAIKRHTAKKQAHQHTVSYKRSTGHEYEHDMNSSPPLSPRTLHIIQLLEEADELLQHNKPAQSDSHTEAVQSRASRQRRELPGNMGHGRPQTAPSRSLAGGATSSKSTTSAHSAASTHLLQAFDELLDRFRLQVLHIDAALAAVD